MEARAPESDTPRGPFIGIAMRTVLLLSVLALAGNALSGTWSGAQESRLRVGTYDPRAIAVAYAPSRFNPVAQKTAEHEAAVKAGDQKRAKELEAWGERHQRALHRMAFAGTPVHDLLAHVKEGMARVAAEQHLTLIVQRCDHAGPEVEVVDVTDALVKLFEPSAKTLATVAEVRKQAPVDLDELEHD